MFAVAVDKLYYRSIGSRDELIDGEYFVLEITSALLSEIEAKNQEVSNV